MEMFNCLGLLGQKFYLRKGPNYDNARGQLFHHIAHNILTSTSTDLVGVPLDVCLYVMSSTEIGDTKYDNLRKTLAPFVNLATKNRVRKRKHEICPKYENTRNQGSFLKLSSLVPFFPIIRGNSSWIFCTQNLVWFVFPLIRLTQWTLRLQFVFHRGAPSPWVYCEARIEIQTWSLLPTFHDFQDKLPYFF